MTMPSRLRSNGRHAFSGASLRRDSGSKRHCRTMLSGLILLSAPPTRKKSAWSRPMMRNASPRASRPATSLSVMRVVRPLGVVQDRDVAGQHVGQVLEHPQRRDDGRPCSPHFSRSTRARLAVGAELGGVGQFVQLGGDQAGAELDAEARRVELLPCRPCRRRAPAGRRRRPAGWCGPSPCRLLRCFLSTIILGVEVGDLAGECGRAGRRCRSAVMGRMPLRPCDERLPEGSQVQADGGEDADAGEDRPTG